jgi:cytochrome P450
MQPDTSTTMMQEEGVGVEGRAILLATLSFGFFALYFWISGGDGTIINKKKPNKLIGSSSSTTTSSTTSSRTTSVPHVPSLLPYVGSGLEYFASPVDFVTRMQTKYGNVFSATVFGHLYLFLMDKQDISAALSLPEKKASLLKAYDDLAGRMLPKEHPNDYININNNNKCKFTPSEIKAKISGASVSGTGPIAHSVRPGRIAAWIPMIQNVLNDSFDRMKATATTSSEDEGQQVELWEWSRQVICAVTVRVLLGNRATRDSTLLHNWVQIFHEANPEAGFGNPLSTLSTLWEIGIHGERQVYVRARELILPYVDEEIEKCIAENNNGDHKDKDNDNDNDIDNDEDASVLSEIIKSWYSTKLGKNDDLLRAARIRLANDMFIFTFAAFSNSFSTAAWILFHTISNTNGVGDKIRNELKDGYTTNCPELTKAILEVARLYTPGAVHRKLMQDWNLPSSLSTSTSSTTTSSTGHAGPSQEAVVVTIPKNTTLLVSAYHCMRHSDSFVRPCEFDTSRYDEGDDDESKSAGRMFLPFGTGAHPCVGKRFAVMEVSLFVAQALQTFDLQVVVPPPNPGDGFGTCEWTNAAVQNCPNHPPLDKTQPGFIWRPQGPVMIQYKLKEGPKK